MAGAGNGARRERKRLSRGGLTIAPVAQAYALGANFENSFFRVVARQVNFPQFVGEAT